MEASASNSSVDKQENNKISSFNFTGVSTDSKTSDQRTNKKYEGVSSPALKFEKRAGDLIADTFCLGTKDEGDTKSTPTEDPNIVVLHDDGTIETGRKVDLLKESGYTYELGDLPVFMSNVNRVTSCQSESVPVQTKNSKEQYRVEESSQNFESSERICSTNNGEVNIDGATQTTGECQNSDIAVEDIKLDISAENNPQNLDTSKLIQNVLIMDGLPFEVQRDSDSTCSLHSSRSTSEELEAPESKPPENTDEKCNDTQNGLAGDVSERLGTCTNDTDEKSSENEKRLQEPDIKEAMPESQFSRIPYEIIQKIFSFFDLEDLCLRVAPVCRKWKVYAYDPIHWTDLSIRSSVTRHQLARLVLRAPFLRKLNLRGALDLSADELLYIARCCPQLRELDLGFIITVDPEAISNIAHNCKHLEVLNIEGCVLVDTACMAYICKEHCLPNLRSLNLSHCTNLEDASLRMLTKTKDKLTSLNIDGIPWMSDDEIIELAKQRGEKMKELWLDGAEMADQCVQSITEHCRQLSLLSLSFADLLTDATLLYIRSMSNLSHLTLKKGQNFSSTALQELFTDGTLCNLKKLDLSECSHLSDEGVAAITKCCGAGLTHLSLCWCWFIQDPGIEHIVNTCRNLEFLDLTGIDKITGRYFINIPTAMPVLTFLSLQQCNKIDDELILNVVKKLGKKLKVIDYYGSEFGEEIFTLADGAQDPGD